MKRIKDLLTRPAAIAILVVMVLILTYLLMLWNTNPVVDYVESVFKGEIPYEEVVNTPLRRYDTTRYRNGSIRDGLADVEIDITRMFVIHNFFDGYMWVKYKNVGYDENGKILYCTSEEFPFYSKWKIHRENGEWVIVDIQEHP